MQSKRYLLAMVLVLVWVVLVANAQLLQGKVVAVSDGDTIKVLDENQRTQTIRLAGIDAPEKNQDFGLHAKHELTELCMHKFLEADVRTTDRYGRTVARVRCDSVDVGTMMLQKGLAWHFTRYAHSQPHQEATEDRQAQDTAKSSGLGLWSQLDPIAPWAWRTKQRETHSH